MGYEIFTWCPHSADSVNRFRVNSAQFGDGYKQSVGDGLNNELVAWSLSFRDLEHKIKPIRDFIRLHKGYKPFYWKPPLETEAFLFEVTEFNVAPLGGRAYSLTATFVQRFAP